VYGCIYLILHRASGKKYVGQTTQKLSERIRCHIKDGETMVGNAMRKHGKNAFDFAIIDGANSLEDLNRKEQEWIKHYGSMKPFGYNYTAGGDGSPGLKHSAESKEKIRLARAKQVITDEARRNMSLARKGKPKSKEWNRKNSEAHKGKSRPHMKLPRTPEWKQKLAEARARWWARATPEMKRHRNEAASRTRAANKNLPE
jgi:group I intron endonuclease